MGEIILSFDENYTRSPRSFAIVFSSKQNSIIPIICHKSLLGKVLHPTVLMYSLLTDQS
jgi:hypothetical protein